jgi:Bifunctional DNA primase/polymerase, N-terminal
VIETDGAEGEAELAEFEKRNGPLPATLVIRSGSGRGLHRHFKHPGYKVKTKANPAIKIDVKGDAGFCVLPPSLHKSGGRYKIEHDEEPAELPRGLLKFIDAAAKAANGAQGNPDTKKGDSDCTGLGVLDEPPEHLGNCGLEPNIPPGKTWQPPPVETMRAMLQHLADKNYFEDREDVVKDANGHILKIGWLETGMALKPAYGDEVGFDLWAVTHLDEKARNDAPGQWASFASEPRPGHVTIGRIIKAAKEWPIHNGC